MFSRLFTRALPPTPPHSPTCPCCNQQVNEYLGYTKAHTLDGPATFCNQICLQNYADSIEKNNNFMRRG